MNPTAMTQPEPMGRPFAFAIGLHVGLFGIIALVGLIHPISEKFGDPNAGGVAVGVEAVDKIPLPHSGPSNPVAHNTEQEAPQAPPEKVQQEKKEVVPPNAVKLKLEDKKKKAKQDSVAKHFKSFDQLEANQLTSRTPQAVSSPLYSQMPGSGRVGTGMNTTLGTEYAAYAQQIQSLIARNWNTGDVNVPSAPVVIASFDLMRDGSVRGTRIVQSSGNPSLDLSVRRDIETVSLPPLPAGFPRSSAHCEFTFELKK